MNIIHYSKSDGFSTPMPSAGKNVVISIDSSLVSTHEITLPKMSKAKAFKAIPFALESQLLDDINTLSFFPLQQAKSTTIDVLVINKAVIKKLEQHVNNANCETIAIIPDFMLLPYSANKITYHEDADTVIFRSDELQGGSLPSNIFKSLYHDKDQLISSDLKFDSLNKFSLLNINTNHWREYLQPWKAPTAIAAILFLFSTAQTLINNSALEAQLIQLSASNEHAFKALFPEVKRIVNIRVQAEQKLTKAKALKANYNNDLLSKLSSQASITTQASKVSLKQGKLTIEAIK